MEIIELKYNHGKTMHWNGYNNRMNRTKERISDLENRAIGISQSE